ncbi:sensor domain-containing diguanylate cyclase [Paenibacillus dendrobii]|uniref:sensor domain-containing diguanylate cyclase n=1 Tax=Paenibacillus dendrobii TaxID=2691084 RepID=UPI001F48C6FC|nr:sensor domain-containing diguanylate cyclase [Paenibacillus dendrobii]
MKYFIKKGFTLRFTISLLVITAILLTMLTSITSAVQVNRASLISNYLNKNESYAKKLASNTNELLITMQENIRAIAKISEREDVMDIQLFDDLFQENTQYFNSIVVADNNRIIRALSPRTVGISIGDKLTSEQSKMAVDTKKPFISEPYRATTGRLIILVSAPIIDKSGHYKGFVGGTIYLEEKNVLSNMLKEHFFGDGSYVFVVEKSGDLIFHPNQKRIGQSVVQNDVVGKVIQGQSGSQRVTNSEGNRFLAGYAYEPSSSWGIISQTPAEVIDKPLYNLVKRMLLVSLPFLLLILLLGWWIANRIAKPLHTLAQFSDEATLRPVPAENIPDIRSYYYEVRLLSQSVKIALQNMNQDLTHLRNEVKIDELTGLANRRAFDGMMAGWVESNIPFALILIDIDHFKHVNDTYGHVVGDDVLRYLARIMQLMSTEDDLCFRYGGEEFGILVKHCGLGRAKDIADRLREQLAVTKSPTGAAITLSAGIAAFPVHGRSVKQLVKKADEALYQSKKDGRNRTTVSKLTDP